MVSRDQIMNVLPHREPFLFLDEVVDYKEGEWGRGRFYVREELDFFRGHFPGNPVLPGVIMVEAAAQLGAFVLLSLEEYSGKMVYFAGIDDVKFRKIVRPGDVLELEVKLEKIRGRFGRGAAAGYTDGEVCFEGGLKFVVADR